jgi:hypothetical protein
MSTDQVPAVRMQRACGSPAARIPATISAPSGNGGGPPRPRAKRAAGPAENGVGYFEQFIQLRPKAEAARTMGVE